MTLDFAIFRVYGDRHEIVTSIGHWESLTLKPGNWHVMAQGIETSNQVRMQIGSEVVTFDPQSKIPLMLPVLYMRVKVEKETPIQLEANSITPYTLYLTQLWDL